MSAPAFHAYPTGLASNRAVHVTVEYRTWGGSPASWARWTEADSLAEAIRAATAHVRSFKRCASIDGGSAVPSWQGLPSCDAEPEDDEDNYCCGCGVPIGTDHEEDCDEV